MNITRTLPGRGEFRVVTSDELDAATCPCCDKPFSEDNPMDLTSRCHTGPVFVSYHDGWIYLSCGECRQTIMCMEVAYKQPK